MKKLIALILALVAIFSAAVAESHGTFTVPGNSKGFNGMDPDRKTPNRVYTGKVTPLKIAKAIDNEGFVILEAGADAGIQGHLQDFAVESIFMVLPNGERVKVADEAVQDTLNLIMARTVRTVKKGKVEGIALNVEPYKKGVHTPTFEVYFVGVGDGRHLTEYVREDGTYTFCTRKGTKKGGSSSKPAQPSEPTVTPTPTATPTPGPTNTPNPEHDPVVLPPFDDKPAPANTPNPQHDSVVLPVFESATSAPQATTVPASDNIPNPQHDTVVLPVFGSAAPAPQAQQSEATATVTTTSSEAVVAVPQVEVEPEKPVVAEPAQEETKSSGSDSGNPDPNHDKVSLPWG